MLPIAILILIGGTGYAVWKAPPDQRVMVGMSVVVLAAAGYAIGLAITTAHTDQRTYYPIAAAIGGAMIAFAWISHKEKSWPKPAKNEEKK